ncbi:hypothetical protein HMPREF6485_0085 [Segatella buccae ATCC 33574]|uniref:Uncharacterized protein n=1 Tax=Segatella buccae ATCC 33574 TaxID=873513 RepID=E6K3A0_9BACT|nr:hypothetical protein HMPREF6485_0085 [Segatella buccae ATCC 33574]
MVPLVVFTFQKEGRCNRIGCHLHPLQLFLPFKKKADATGCGSFRLVCPLFLPFKKKADATDI